MKCLFCYNNFVPFFWHFQTVNCQHCCLLKNKKIHLKSSYCITVFVFVFLFVVTHVHSLHSHNAHSFGSNIFILFYCNKQSKGHLLNWQFQWWRLGLCSSCADNCSSHCSVWFGALHQFFCQCCSCNDDQSSASKNTTTKIFNNRLCNWNNIHRRRKNNERKKQTCINTNMVTAFGRITFAWTRPKRRARKNDVWLFSAASDTQCLHTENVHWVAVDQGQSFVSNKLIIFICVSDKSLFVSPVIAEPLSFAASWASFLWQQVLRKILKEIWKNLLNDMTTQMPIAHNQHCSVRWCSFHEAWLGDGQKNCFWSEADSFSSLDQLKLLAKSHLPLSVLKPKCNLEAKQVARPLATTS